MSQSKFIPTPQSTISTANPPDIDDPDRTDPWSHEELAGLKVGQFPAADAYSASSQEQVREIPRGGTNAIKIFMRQCMDLFNRAYYKETVPIVSLWRVGRDYPLGKPALSLYDPPRRTDVIARLDTMILDAPHPAEDKLREVFGPWWYHQSGKSRNLAVSTMWGDPNDRYGLLLLQYLRLSEGRLKLDAMFRWSEFARKFPLAQVPKDTPNDMRMNYISAGGMLDREPEDEFGFVSPISHYVPRGIPQSNGERVGDLARIHKGLPRQG